ncbi:MAG: hypothetical protein PVJ98_11935, partial [Akkermansiaceae bacterium]
STGPLVLFDPPAIPPGDRAAWKRVGKRIMVGCRKRLNVYQTDRKFFDTVRKYAQEGKIRLDPDDLNAVRDAQRVAVDFKLAMLKYRLSEYSGPVYILGTSDRLGKASVPGAIPNTWHERMRGDLRVFNVGQKHGEVHDVENALFVRKTREVMSLVDEYFAVQSRDPTNSV